MNIFIIFLVLIILSCSFTQYNIPEFYKPTERMLH